MFHLSQNKPVGRLKFKPSGQVLSLSRAFSMVAQVIMGEENVSIAARLVRKKSWLYTQSGADKIVSLRQGCAHERKWGRLGGGTEKRREGEGGRGKERGRRRSEMEQWR